MKYIEETKIQAVDASNARGGWWFKLGIVGAWAATLGVGLARTGFFDSDNRRRDRCSRCNNRFRCMRRGYC